MVLLQAITIRFQHSLDDHLHAYRLYYRTTGFHLMDKVIAVLLLALGIVNSFADGGSWWAVAFLVLAVLQWFNLLSLYPLKVRAEFKQNARLQEPYELTFDELDIRFHTPSVDSHVDWARYSRAIEDERLFLLVYDKWGYSVIPKRAFPNEEEVLNFRELVRREVPEYRRVRPQ